MECFPDDILINIFCYLPFNEIISAQRVCRGWLSYLVTEPRLYRHVSFLNSKHPIPLKTLRAVIAICNARISSMEFNASTLMHLTPLAPIYPSIQRLVIMQETGYMGTIFHIAMRKPHVPEYYPLPQLRTAIFHCGMLLNNEVMLLLSSAPNLEELECRSAWVMLNLSEILDDRVKWKIKRLTVEHYQERVVHDISSPPNDDGEPHRYSRTVALTRFMEDLEELTLGVDSKTVMDLSRNTKIRYLDFTKKSTINSFIQPPSSLRVCLHAPALHRQLPDEHPTIWPPHSGEPKSLFPFNVLLWNDPPQFRTLSLVAPACVEILPRALCNSYQSLVSLAVQVHRIADSPTAHFNLASVLQTQALPDLVSPLVNLRYLDVSESPLDDIILARIPPLSLEYVCLARTKVTSRGVSHFIARARECLREINVVETEVGEEIELVTRPLGIELEKSYPGKPVTCD